MTSVFRREGEGEGTYGEGRRKAELQTRAHQVSVQGHRSQERCGLDPPSEPPEGAHPANTQTSDFRSPKL